MTLHLDFVFSYETGSTLGRMRDHVSLPSTTTWSEMVKEMVGYNDIRAIRREWPVYAWPGGYPIFYMVKDGSWLCPRCANRELARTLDKDNDQFFIVDSGVNYEDPEMWCDHCNERIPSAYVEDERKHLYSMVCEYDRLRGQGDMAAAREVHASICAWVDDNPIFEGMIP